MASSGPKTSSERCRKYRENIKEQTKLSDIKQRVNELKKTISDPEYAKEKKEKSRLRKQKQRQKEKEVKENSTVQSVEFIDDAQLSEAHKVILGDSSSTSPVLNLLSNLETNRKNCNVKKLRKKTFKAKNAMIKALKVENSELKKSQNAHDDQLVEMDIKVRELELKVKKEEEKMEQFVKDNEENDDWVNEVYKNMNSDSKRDFRNAFKLALPDYS